MTKKQKTILIVEDSPVQAASIGRLIRETGLEVLYAPDGRDGVDMAERYLPDLVVLDLEMPRMNGLETCRRLKENARTAEIPVIILTQHADRADLIIEGLGRGAVDFIPKDSFAGAVLLETLRQLDILQKV